MYSTTPDVTLRHRWQYLCKEYGVNRKHNSWNQCWRVWVTSMLTIESIWPADKTRWTLRKHESYRRGVHAATIIEGQCTIFYCDALGNPTSQETLTYEWYAPILDITLGEELKWESPLGCSTSDLKVWVSTLLKDPHLKQIALVDTQWNRAIHHANIEDSTSM